jgi:hypothetical protein
MKKKKTGTWRDLLTNKLFDLLIVITGVTIAFQLSNWKSNADQHARNNFYKENLRREVEMDIRAQQEILASLESDKRFAERFLNARNASPDSLVKVVIEVLSLETFTPHQNTYLTMLQGNGLNGFDDRNLPGQITQYYSTYTVIRRFEDVYTNALFRVHEYFSPHCDYRALKLVDDSLLKNHETRNLLLIVISQLNDGIDAHREAIQEAKALQALL